MQTLSDVEFSSSRDSGCTVQSVKSLGDRRPQSIRLASGASASIVGGPNAERLQVYSAPGQLLFEYDPIARRTRLYVAPGDLEVVAAEGAIDLRARDGIRLHSGATVDVAGQLGVRLHAGGESAEGRTELSVQPHTAQLTAPHLRLSGAQLETRAVDMQVTAGSFTAHVHRARLVTKVLETVADTLVASARTIVRRVTGLFQLRAANVHMGADDHFQVQSERVVVKAADDVKILGEQIHLG